MLATVKEWMKTHALPPGEFINNQNHGQIRVCPQGRLEEKEEISDPGDKRERLWDLSPKLVVQCLLGALLPCRKETLPRGPWVSVCVCSCRISFHLKMSAAPCFSKSVNAESSLERPGLDLVYPMASSGSCRLFSVSWACIYLVGG